MQIKLQSTKSKWCKLISYQLYDHMGKDQIKNRMCSNAMKGYKSPQDEDRAENMILKGKQRQAHVGEDEILSQEMQNLEQLQIKRSRD